MKGFQECAECGETGQLKDGLCRYCRTLSDDEIRDVKPRKSGKRNSKGRSKDRDEDPFD